MREVIAERICPSQNKFYRSKKDDVNFRYFRHGYPANQSNLIVKRKAQQLSMASLLCASVKMSFHG